MNQTTPKISVIMSVYNAEKHLRNAIESILDQTFKDFEFIIINDGSTDESLEIIKSYHDSRIRLIEQDNQGLTISLNTGIKASQGQYIARMDADDVSLPDRFRLQVTFLDSNPDHGLLGTTFFVIDDQSHIKHVVPVMLNNTEIRQELLHRTPFAHGCIMIRKADLNKLDLPSYNIEFRVAQDYELWSRLAQVTKLANLEKALYLWRDSTDSVSGRNKPKQRSNNYLTVENNQNNKNLLNAKSFSWPLFFKYHNSVIEYEDTRYPLKRKNAYTYCQLMLGFIALKKKFFLWGIILIISSFIMQPVYIIKASFKEVRR